MTDNRNPYDQLLLQIIMDNGDIGGGRERADSSSYGDFAGAWTIREHILGGGFRPRSDKPCGWDTTRATVQESAIWHESAETFGENTHVTGLQADDLACRCGRFRGVFIQWRADTSEAIHAVMRRLAEIGALDLRGLQADS